MVCGNNDRGGNSRWRGDYRRPPEADPSVSATRALACGPHQVPDTSAGLLAVGDRLAVARVASRRKSGRRGGRGRCRHRGSTLNRGDLQLRLRTSRIYIRQSPIRTIRGLRGGSNERTTPFELASTDAGVAIHEPPADSSGNAHAVVEPGAAAAAPQASRWPAWLTSSSLSRGLMFTWMGFSALIAVGQICRIVRFRRRLRGAMPAPDFLVDEAVRIGLWLGVNIPDLYVVDDLGTPLLWMPPGPSQASASYAVGQDAAVRALAGNLDSRARASKAPRSVGESARARRRIDLVVEPALLAHPRSARCGSRARFAMPGSSRGATQRPTPHTPRSSLRYLLNTGLPPAKLPRRCPRCKASPAPADSLNGD